MTEENLILARILEAVAVTKPHIPLTIDLWGGDEVAQFLKRDRRTTMERIVVMPTFPRAIRLPTISGGKGQPLWKAAEVVAWADSYQEAERRFA